MKANRPACLVLLACMACICAFASPAFRQKKTVKQPDGTFLTIVKAGNEKGVYYRTVDGIPVTQNASGGYHYATGSATGTLEAAPYLAHDKRQRSPKEAETAEECKKAWENFRQREQGMKTRVGIGTAAGAGIRQTGAPLIPVVLVNFADKKIGQDGYAPNKAEVTAFFKRHFNGDKYKEGKYAGSVRDYFISQSDSLFKPRFDILGPVTLKHASSYYGSNLGGFDTKATEMMAEAIEQLTGSGIDFSAYTTAGNNVPLTAFVYAGDGEHATGNSDDVMACYYPYFRSQIGANLFQTALCVNETADYDGKGQQPDGIGTFCHEFSHAMGLPDFYNTNGLSNIFGLDAWDIMDYGQYVDSGHRPTGYSAYEREFMGWLHIDTLETKKQIVTLAPLASHETGQKRAYKILNDRDATGNEYYILENRQPSAWFDEEYGKGMLVYHIDYNLGAWTGNSVNNSRSHQRMTIIPADGILTPSYHTDDMATFQGDTYPGLTNNTELSDNSTPCDTAYTGRYMNKLLAGIKEDEKGNISFSYMAKSKLTPPKNMAVVKESDTQIDISWTNVDFAECYVVSIEQEDKQLRTDTVNTTSYCITNLSPEREYTIKVQAIADEYIESEWQYITIQAGPSMVYGTIADATTTARIWTMDGIYRGRKKLSELQKGIYIIERGNKHKKIFVP